MSGRPRRRIAILGLEQLQEFQQGGRIPRYALEERRQGFGARPFKLFQTTIGKDDLKYLYKRDGLAANAVDVPAYDVFSKWFKVRAYNGNVVDSKLDDAIWEINQRLNVKGVFLEAYRYCRLYGLGIVVLGLVDSVGDISQPPEEARGVEYLAAYSSAEISRILFDEDPESRTYGEIQAYEINVKGKAGTQTKTIHAGRVVHVMERTLEKSPWGLNILEPAYDLFQILKNIDWAAGEAYYQNASPTFVLSYEGTPSEEQLDQAEEYLKEISVKSRYIKPKNWELTTVTGSGQALDPTRYWEPIVERIAGAVKVPKQLLLGTAAGALASGQVNLAQYYKDIASIQSDFIEPLLMGFYRRLQEWGILPKGDFDLVWNPLWELDERERAQLELVKVQTARTLVGDGTAPALATVEEARKSILGLEPQLGLGADERRGVPNKRACEDEVQEDSKV